MNTKHTPGPWALNIRQIEAPPRNRDAPTAIAWVADVGASHQLYVGEPDGNARLIAAAPELLAALSALEQATSDEGTKGVPKNVRDIRRSTALMNARAAIAKATQE